MREKAVALLTALVAIGFAIVYNTEQLLPAFWVAFQEETVARIVPLFFTYYYLETYKALDAEDWIGYGLVVGLTFGLLELFVVKLSYAPFSLAMLTPLIFVHVANGVMQSGVLAYSFKNKIYKLIPVILIITIMWHMLYNSTWYVI